MTGTALKDLHEQDTWQTGDRKPRKSFAGIFPDPLSAILNSRTFTNKEKCDADWLSLY
jgi:hypothetical protein